MNALTPGEKAYLESGGQDASALLAENASATPTPSEINDAARAAAASPEPAKTETPPAPAVAAEPAPQPEPPEPGEEDIPAADGKTKRRMVDSRALKAEREARRKLEADLQAEREIRARVDERLKLLSAAVEQPEPSAQEPVEDDAPIDPNQDIFGAFNQLKRNFERLQASYGETAAQTQEDRQTAATVSTYRQDAAAFRAQTPDFNEAYNFLLGKREEQLKAIGYQDTDIRRMLYDEEMSLVNRAIGSRMSPSAHIYALAKSMGYQAPAPQAQPAPAAALPAQAAPTASAPAAAVPNVSAEIDRIKAGQQSSRSLSSGGGAAGEELSLEALAEMPQKDFEKFMNVPGNRERVESALGSRHAA